MKKKKKISVAMNVVKTPGNPVDQGYDWNDVKVVIGGKEITDIKPVEFTSDEISKMRQQIKWPHRPKRKP